MADEKKSGEAEAAEAGEEGGGGKGNLLLILVLVLLLANMGLTAFSIVSGGGGGGDEEVSEEPGPLHPLEPFVLNLDEPGADRYLRLKLAIELDEEDTIEMVALRGPIIRDKFLAHLGAQQVDTLRTKESKDRLRAELTELAREVVSERGVRNVYFTEFIIQ